AVAPGTHFARPHGALAGRSHRRAWHWRRHRLRRSHIPVATGMRWTAGLALAVLALLPIEEASAHPPFAGATGFYGGLLHPLFVPAHAPAVLGFGAVRREAPRRRCAVARAV